MKHVYFTIIIYVFSSLFLAHSLAANGQGDTPAGLEREHLENIRNQIKEHQGWKPHEYSLEHRAEWDHDRLPLIIAIHKELMIDWSPHFFILPDNSLLTPYDDDAFNKVLEQVFPEINEDDAHMLAELSLIFGVFGTFVGDLDNSPSAYGLNEGITLRDNKNPTIRISENTIILEFYSYDYELLILYDCIIRIENNEYSSKFEQIGN